MTIFKEIIEGYFKKYFDGKEVEIDIDGFQQYFIQEKMQEIVESAIDKAIEGYQIKEDLKYIKSIKNNIEKSTKLLEEAVDNTPKVISKQWAKYLIPNYTSSGYKNNKAIVNWTLVSENKVIGVALEVLENGSLIYLGESFGEAQPLN